jgi:DMSO/TMAO reductase YedYZ molybdopterin-dependent catalytic subunit
MKAISRRKAMLGGVAAVIGLAGVAAADRLARRYGLIPPDCGGVYGPGETLDYAAARVLTTHLRAREFDRGMISKEPFANEAAPAQGELKRQQEEGFRNWRLSVDGLVARPTSFSMADLKALGTRSQITEVACEEGWSYIAEWIGTPLGAVLKEVGVLPQARYVAYFSMETAWWDSLELSGALHPQTLLAWGMNDGDLPMKFGGPLRMRVPQQLGYKSVKYIARLTITDTVKNIGKGLGSVSPEYGYSWYAGI